MVIVHHPILTGTRRHWLRHNRHMEANLLFFTGGSRCVRPPIAHTNIVLFQESNGQTGTKHRHIFASDRLLREHIPSVRLSGYARLEWRLPVVYSLFAGNCRLERFVGDRQLCVLGRCGAVAALDSQFAHDMHNSSGRRQHQSILDRPHCRLLSRCDKLG